MNLTFETDHKIDMSDYTFNMISELQEEAENVISGRKVDVMGMPGLDGFFYATFACGSANDQELLSEWFGNQPARKAA